MMGDPVTRKALESIVVRRRRPVQGSHAASEAERTAPVVPSSPYCVEVYFTDEVD